MTGKRFCRLCGGEITLHGSRTARLTLCDDCRARILGRYVYRLEHHIVSKETCCLVCGKPIPQGHGSYTTCCQAHQTLLNSVTANYRKARASNQDKAWKEAHPGGIYTPPTPKRVLSPLGRAEQEAREHGITYGLYMALKGGMAHEV